jgi:beta-xylosidase
MYCPELGTVVTCTLAFPIEAGHGAFGSFTGAFVGTVAFAMSGSGRPEDFRTFRYDPAAGNVQTRM